MCCSLPLTKEWSTELGKDVKKSNNNALLMHQEKNNMGLEFSLGEELGEWGEWGWGKDVLT